MKIPAIEFGRLAYEEDEGQGAAVRSFDGVRERDYFKYLDGLMRNGFNKREEYELGVNSFSVFEKDGGLVLASYYPKTKEARIVTEPDCAYLDFADTPRGERVTPLFTQIDLEDFGESVVVRLSDGRFIIYDGGREFEPDADKLIACLLEQSPHEKPIVAAWIMTHPHIDHYRCFITLQEKYPGEFTVERFIYNFTDTEDSDIERIPKLIKEREGIRLFKEKIAKTGAVVYKAHTGQVYNIGGARLEMLSTPDDTLISPVEDINALSLVVKMTVEGQAIMMCADAFLPAARLAERFGDYLKSDILQPPHHMFVGGDVDAYNLIDPKVCVVPTFEADCYARISPYQKICKKENLHLFYGMNVEEFYTGSTGNVVLPLPYSPKSNGKKLYHQTLEKYRKAMGAESWYFMDVTREECDFSFVNISAEEAAVTVDLYFEDIANYVHNISLTVPSMRTKRVNILNTEEVDGNALYYNNHALTKKGIPDGAVFTVHIKSDIPIVVKGKKPADFF